MSYEVPNLVLLRQFQTIAEEGGITRAAKRLRISQPALSKNLRRLEEMLGTPLFQRHSGGAELTDAGRLFHERVQIIGLEYQHALFDIGNMLSEQQSTIRIGAGPIWTSTILPRVVSRFHKAFPNYRLQVRTGNAMDLSDDLRMGRIDLFAGALRPESRPPGFTARPLYRNEMVILASESHPLMGAPASEIIARLADYPFVAFVSAQHVLRYLSDYMRQRNARPLQFLLETDSLFACVEMVRGGEYLLYESRMVAEHRIGEGLGVLPIDPVAPFDIGIMHRQDLDRLPPYRKLIQIMTAVLDETRPVQEQGA